jgi:hypothetical protein
MVDLNNMANAFIGFSKTLHGFQESLMKTKWREPLRHLRSYRRLRLIVMKTRSAKKACRASFD